MFYDLNVPWTTSQAELQKTLGFLVERECLSFSTTMDSS